MYLIHVQLTPPPGGRGLPTDAVRSIIGANSTRGRIEHVVAHPDHQPLPVIGIYLNADTTEAALLLAETIWWQAWRTVPRLRPWRLTSVLAPTPLDIRDLSGRPD